MANITPPHLIELVTESLGVDPDGTVLDQIFEYLADEDFDHPTSSQEESDRLVLRFYTFLIPDRLAPEQTNEAMENMAEEVFQWTLATHNQFSNLTSNQITALTGKLGAKFAAYAGDNIEF